MSHPSPLCLSLCLGLGLSTLPAQQQEPPKPPKQAQPKQAQPKQAQPRQAQPKQAQRAARAIRLVAPGARAPLTQDELEKRLAEKLASPWMKNAQWHTELSAAKQAAAAAGKPIFAYFTRSYAP